MRRVVSGRIEDKIRCASCNPFGPPSLPLPLVSHTNNPAHSQFPVCSIYQEEEDATCLPAPHQQLRIVISIEEDMINGRCGMPANKYISKLKNLQYKRSLSLDEVPSHLCRKSSYILSKHQHLFLEKYPVDKSHNTCLPLLHL